MRLGVGRPSLIDDVIGFFPTPDLVVSVVAAIFSKYIFAIMPHFRDDTAGVRKEFALFLGFPLAAGEHHDGYVLIGFCSSPLGMP